MVSHESYCRIPSLCEIVRNCYNHQGKSIDAYEGIRQYDSSDTGHSDNVNIAAEHQEPAEVLSQLDNTSNSPVYGEYKCC